MKCNLEKHPKLGSWYCHTHKIMCMNPKCCPKGTDELVQITKDQQRVIIELRPGIGHIAYDDFGHLNDTCLAAEKVIRMFDKEGA